MATDTRLDSIVLGCILALYKNPVLDPQIIKAGHQRLLALFVGLLLLLLLPTFLYRDVEFRNDIRYSLQGLAMFPLFYVVIVAHCCP